MRLFDALGLGRRKMVPGLEEALMSEGYLSPPVSAEQAIRRQQRGLSFGYVAPSGSMGAVPASPDRGKRTPLIAAKVEARRLVIERRRRIKAFVKAPFAWFVTLVSRVSRALGPLARDAALFAGLCFAATTGMVLSGIVVGILKGKGIIP